MKTPLAATRSARASQAWQRPGAQAEIHAIFTVRDGSSFPHVVVAEMSHPA